MDIEKLIEDLRGLLKQYGEKIPYGELVGAPWPYSKAGDLVWPDPEPYFIEQAATALSTLQAENKRLNKIVCSIPKTPDSGRTVSQYDKEMSMCAYLDDLEAENEKLRAELEQVKAERGALIEDFVDYVTGGVPNPAIFCKNRCSKCVDMRGWCTGKNCNGFYPSGASGQKED